MRSLFLYFSARSSAKMGKYERLLPKGTSFAKADKVWRAWHKKGANMCIWGKCRFSYLKHKIAQPLQLFTNDSQQWVGRREDEQGSSGGTSETYTCRKKQRESITPRKVNCEQPLLDMLKDKSEHSDGHKMFLLSLVSAFKELNIYRKYWATMEMLGTVTKTDSMAFQPHCAQCFAAITSLPQTYLYDYNLQYQNTSSEGRWFDPSWCQWIFH